MKKPPAISVIMCVFNGEKYLSQSIESILTQSFTDFEFIIIDDGSADNSLKIIQEYQKEEKQIVLISNKNRQGVAQSRNTGLKLAKGKYVAIIDADDICFKKRLERQYNFLERNPEIFLCGSEAILIGRNGERYGKINLPRNPEKFLPKQNCFIHSSLMFRNKEVRYREKFFSAEDYDLTLRLLTRRKKLINIDRILILYRIHKSGMTYSDKYSLPLFTQKAQQFYHERKIYGKDSYRKFNLPRISNSKTKSGESMMHESLLLFLLKNRGYKKSKYYFEHNVNWGNFPFWRWYIFYLFVHFPFIFELIYKIYRPFKNYKNLLFFFY